MHLITSRDNPLVKELRRLSQDSTAYRKHGRVWLEGDHLCRALLTRGHAPEQAVFAQSAWEQADPELTQTTAKNVVLSDALFREISGLESAASMGFVWVIPSTTDGTTQGNTVGVTGGVTGGVTDGLTQGETDGVTQRATDGIVDSATATASQIQKGVPSVFLDRIQDAGNVGSILRSASAFGFTQVLARKGTAALWSPKVLRSGMGAHFGLHLVESVEPEQLTDLQIAWLSTSSHQGPFLHTLGATNPIPSPCGWIFGHEGQGVSAEVAQLAHMTVRIAQPGGEESLNVASAAAVCMHASVTMARA
jgi:RNA methyltransferase, TrmH family